MLEKRRGGPAAEFDERGAGFGKDAWKIFGDTAAGDVRHAGYEVCSGEFLDDAEVAAVRLHQRGAGFFFEFVDVLVGGVLCDFEK